MAVAAAVKRGELHVASAWRSDARYRREKPRHPSCVTLLAPTCGPREVYQIPGYLKRNRERGLYEMKLKFGRGFSLSSDL